MSLIPPNRSQYFTKDGDLTLRAAKYLESLAETVNTIETTIETETISEFFIGSSAAASVNTDEIAQDEAFFYRQNQTANNEWNALIAESTYYALPWDFIEAKTSTIYLPQYPENSSCVIVASDYSGSVIVYGYGNKIKVKDSVDSIQINQRGTSLHFVFFAAGAYWRIV